MSETQLAKDRVRGPMAGWVAAIMAVLAVGGQIANYVLNLKLRASLMESEERVLNQVAAVYRRQDVCAAQMQLLDACPQIRGLRQRMASPAD